MRTTPAEGVWPGSWFALGWRGRTSPTAASVRRFGSWRPYIAAASFKPVLAAGLAVIGLYVAGTLSGALLEDELARPKMSDTISDRTEFGTWTEVLPNPPLGGHETIRPLELSVLGRSGRLRPAARSAAIGGV